MDQAKQRWASQDLNRQIIHQSAAWKSINATKHSERQWYFNITSLTVCLPQNPSTITTFQHGDHIPH